MDVLYAHARFDGLGLGARSQWVGKGKTSTLHALGNYASKRHYTCYNSRPFLFDLDLYFVNVYMANI